MTRETLLPADNLIGCFEESTTDCVKVLDTDARLLSFSDNGYKIMEIDNPKDVLGKDWLSFWTGEMAPKAQAAFAKAKAGNYGYFEGFCPTMKGTPKWWQVSIVPLKNDLGDVEWILSMSRDVTELHTLRAENAELKRKLTHKG
ncbi:MAG: PAS domain-containing protein [Candidatus Saccharimonadales bacterium]